MGKEKEYDEHELLAQAQSNQDLSVTIVDHPLVRHYLGKLRNKETPPREFRDLIEKITIPLLLEATGDLSEVKVEVDTPLTPITTRQIKEQIVFVPVLRSGLGMMHAANEMFPDAVTAHVGLERDENTAEPHWYYDIKKLENLNGGKNTVFLVLDPMLATGGSGAETVGRIEEAYPAAKIKFVGVLAAPEGIKAMNEQHPGVEIVMGAVDERLNDIAYIVPGLGDAGDRQFGT